jgi:hypothetical protein
MPMTLCAMQAHADDIWLTGEVQDCPAGMRHAIVTSDIHEQPDLMLKEDACYAFNPQPTEIEQRDFMTQAANGHQWETFYSAGARRSIGQTLATGEVLSVIIFDRRGIVAHYMALRQEVSPTPASEYGHVLVPAGS